MRGYWGLLLLLSATWGASYLFIKVAIEDIAPAPLMAARLLIAAAVLLGYLAFSIGLTNALRELRSAWRALLVLGAMNAAVPFWLIAWGEQHIDSSVAAIAQATVPIFNLVLGLRFLPADRVTTSRVAGLGLGAVGVAVLAGLNPVGGWLAAVGTLAVVLSSLSYAGAGIYGQLRVRTVRGPVLAAGSMLCGGIFLLPLGLAQLPSQPPDAASVASLLALALAGTAMAQLVLYRMLRLHGAARVSLVTYLLPAFALFYGAALLDEPVTASVLAGLGLILLGVALASGARLLRRWKAVSVPAWAPRSAARERRTSTSSPSY
jgi:drug/metabolite transporter (DMT)-like permease